MKKGYFTAIYSGTGFTRDYLRRLKHTAKFTNVRDGYGNLILTHTQNVITKGIIELLENVNVGDEVQFTATYNNTEQKLLYIKKEK